MTLIVHHHIFKNAGTTIDWILERNFPRRVLHIESVDPGGRLSSQKIRTATGRRSHRAISSHSFPLPSPKDAWAVIHLSVLRDPIERYASIYRFERSREADHSANHAARNLDVNGFCTWWLEQESGIWINWQTRCCTPQFGLDIVGQFVSAASGVAPTIFRAQRFGGRQTCGPPGWDADLGLALRAALKTALVLTVDHFDQGLVVLERRLRAQGYVFDASYIRQNVTREESEKGKHSDEVLSSELREQIIAANYLDYALLRQVNDHLDSYYRALDPTGDHLADFRERCKRLSATSSQPPVRIPEPSKWVLVPDELP